VAWWISGAHPLPRHVATARGLVSDFTYIKTGESWLDLATVVHLSTRTGGQLQLASHMRSSLVVDDALRTGDRGRPRAVQTVFHSGRGVQLRFNRSWQHRMLNRSIGRRPYPAT